MMVDAVRGTLRVRRWPKKRGPPKSAAQRFWIDWFRQANLLAKYADPMSQIRSKEIAAGSGLYPRDVLLKAMRGRLYTFTDETGWIYFPMAAVQDISESLDVLAQTVGDILVRATDRWRPPPAGVLGDVLTNQGPGTPPEWKPASGGGVAFGGALVDTLANQSIPNGTSTVINFTNEVYDTDAIHDNAVNNTRLTVPAGWSKVRLNGAVIWATSSVNDRYIWFRKNGGGFVGQAQIIAKAAAKSAVTTQSPAVAVVAGDYFEMVVFQNRGSALNVLGPNGNTYFAMERAQ